ncbi:glycosyltransferase family 2 protein [Rhodohalobacter mucosus]|uniref:Glycosyltransferase 2-like domain-containing protein n=1 Tax=Rhodohalobacter mucosus TaxID=2079485 RepID=A0A316TVH6_9BACT|nr:glycosyltransferase [Rhodohalobacter mucosus]PWN07811.1 hypothetical protein DDZ15_02010 [Rhodohalobacter mucosus]
MNQPVRFSVIIPTFRDTARLTACMESVLKCGTEQSFEVIVVNNAPEHQASEFLFGDPRVKVLHEPAHGSYMARNRGAEAARGTYLAFTDSDCIVDPEWLAEAEKVFQGRDCDLLGGHVELFKVPGANGWIYIYEKNHAFRQDLTVPRGQGVTANLFVRKKVFDELGGFDKSMLSGGDWEFTSRAVNRGFRLCYAPGVKIRHPARESFSSFFRKQKRLAAWGYQNGKIKHHHSGLRMLGSHLLNNGRNIFVQTGQTEKSSEKPLIFLLASAIYIYKTVILSAIVVHIINAEKVTAY